MKELIFLKGNSANLPENRSEGTFYHVQDTKTIYLDDMVLEDSEAIKQAIETIIVDNELVTAQALTDLKDTKADISALTNYALLSDVPTKVSDLENDENYFIATMDGDGSNFLSDDGTYKKISVNGYATEQWVTEQGFLTEHQDISHLATQEALDNIDAKYADKELVTAAALTDLNKNKADKTEILTYSITKINESLEENVLEAYALTNSNGDEVGDRINIYKDSALQSAVLDEQELVLTYLLSDGSTSIIRADISKFLHEDEFGNGLEITDNIVNIKIANDSEAFLTLDENGIKLYGVQTAIDTVKEELLGDYSEIEEEYQLNTLASINQTILDNEQAIAAALTDLEETKAEKSDVAASLESISSVVDSKLEVAVYETDMTTLNTTLDSKVNISDYTAKVSTLEASISAKQDKLTAGTNIEIANNVVSCTIDTELYITVSELPTEDIKTNKVYILLNSENGEQNIHEEYMYINGAWEKVGENQDKFVSQEEFQELYDGVSDNELVTAAALTDLNERLDDEHNTIEALQQIITTLQQEINDIKAELNKTLITE